MDPLDECKARAVREAVETVHALLAMNQEIARAALLGALKPLRKPEKREPWWKFWR